MHASIAHGNVINTNEGEPTNLIQTITKNKRADIKIIIADNEYTIIGKIKSSVLNAIIIKDNKNNGKIIFFMSNPKKNLKAGSLCFGVGLSPVANL